MAIKDVSVEQAEKIAEKQDTVILDVRTPEEFADGRIDGAVNINCYDDDFADRLNMMDKNKKFLVYCEHGRRSQNAAFLMEELGFKDINNMLGGFAEWEEKGKPVE